MCNDLYDLLILFACIYKKLDCMTFFLCFVLLKRSSHMNKILLFNITFSMRLHIKIWQTKWQSQMIAGETEYSAISTWSNVVIVPLSFPICSFYLLLFRTSSRSVQPQPFSRLLNQMLRPERCCFETRKQLGMWSMVGALMQVDCVQYQDQYIDDCWTSLSHYRQRCKNLCKTLEWKELFDRKRSVICLVTVRKRFDRDIFLDNRKYNSSIEWLTLECHEKFHSEVLWLELCCPIFQTDISAWQPCPMWLAFEIVVISCSSSELMNESSLKSDFENNT